VNFIFVPKALNSLVIPQILRAWIVVVKNYIFPKPNMYYTNYHHINHNVETCKVKKEGGTHYIIVVEDIV
jgi:hypothetical protein